MVWKAPELVGSGQCEHTAGVEKGRGRYEWSETVPFYIGGLSDLLKSSWW